MGMTWMGRYFPVQSMNLSNDNNNNKNNKKTKKQKDCKQYKSSKIETRCKDIVDNEGAVV